MSWNNVRPYFNGCMEELGFREHADGFATDNIPDTVLDKSFHVGLGPIDGISQNQLDQESNMSVVLRTYHKGYRDSQRALDEAISSNELILKRLVKVQETGGRTTTGGIMNVVFNEAAFDPIDASNDNAVVVTSSYTVRIVVAVNE